MSIVKAAGFIVYHPDHGVYGYGPTLDAACLDAVRWSEDCAAGNPSRGGVGHSRDTVEWRYLPATVSVLTALSNGAGNGLAWCCVGGVAALPVED